MVTLKQGHELIRTGPYRAIRHPIYTGILLTSEKSARLAVAMVLSSFYIKAAAKNCLSVRNSAPVSPNTSGARECSSQDFPKARALRQI